MHPLCTHVGLQTGGGDVAIWIVPLRCGPQDFMGHVAILLTCGPQTRPGLCGQIHFCPCFGRTTQDKCAYVAIMRTWGP